MHGQVLKWLSYYRQLQSGCVWEAGGGGEREGGSARGKKREGEGGESGQHILHPYETPLGSSYSLAEQLASHFILGCICVVVLGLGCVCGGREGREGKREGRGRGTACREDPEGAGRGGKEGARDGAEEEAGNIRTKDGRRNKGRRQG